MTPEVQEYFETAIKLQTEMTFKIVERLGEELFPGDGTKILALMNILKDALDEVHTKTAEFMQAKVKLS